MAQKDAKYHHISLQLTYHMVQQYHHPTLSEAFHSSPFFKLYLLYT